MSRLLIVLGLSIGVMILLPRAVFSQSDNSGSICVLAYEDFNQNGQRDETEVPLPGISVTLAIQETLIIQDYLTTDADEFHCFQGLSAQAYQLEFVEGANHQATTENSAMIQLEGGQSLQVQFGAVPTPLDAPPAEAETSAETRLDTTDRLLIAALGAFLVMSLMFGLGLVIFSLLSG